MPKTFEAVVVFYNGASSPFNKCHNLWTDQEVFWRTVKKMQTSVYLSLSILSLLTFLKTSHVSSLIGPERICADLNGFYVLVTLFDLFSELA